MSTDKGLVISLKEDVPTIIKFGDQEVHVYAIRVKGSLRTRFVADKSVRIYGPAWVKKGVKENEEVISGTP